MAANSELMKQYKDLVRTIDSFSNGQASISEAPTEEEEDTLTIIYINISPSDGPYKGGTFLFKFDLSNGYPEDQPRINCLTKVYHPNIDQIDEYSEGDICLNLMDELWTPELTLEDYVQGLLFMFYNPNIEDPLNPAFTGGETQEEFQDNILKSMRGEEIDGVEYEAVYKNGEEDTQFDKKDMTTPISISEDHPLTVAQKSDAILDTSTTDRDEATGQCEDLPKESKEDTLMPHLPMPTQFHTPNGWFGYSMTLMLLGVSVWAGFHILKRLPINRLNTL